MNISMVVIGHLTNPFDLNGGFSVQFTAEDFSADNGSGRTSSRGFNLSVDAGSAKSSSIHFLVVRLADGLRIEGFAECLRGKRNFESFTGAFSAPDRAEAIGRFDFVLHWDGTQGILSANWTAPRNV
jgi:hypothetical protein